jgi:flagellar hook assembly protein FlgD
MNSVSDVILLSGNTETAAFDPQAGGLTIRIPNQGPAGQPAQSVDFTWVGTNNNGQDVEPGSYYVKITVTDPYGNAVTVIKDVQVLKDDKYVRISIYNSAGEIVQRTYVPYTGGKVVNLNVDPTFYIGTSGASTTIKYGDSGTQQWDGTNMLGKLVTSGTYEIEVEIKTGDGYTAVASKTITVLNQANGPVLSGVKFYPNPFIVSGSASMEGPMAIAWNGNGLTGKVHIKIYNVAAELVSRIEANIADGAAAWNLRSVNGELVSSGFYVAMIESITTNGQVERRVVKLSVIRKF